LTWIKLDDNAVDHPKIEALSDRAFRWWMRGLSYASRFLTDGVLPPVFWKKVPNSVRAELSAVKLWDWADPNFIIHDYLIHQSKREDVEADRARNREKAASFRERRRSESRTVTGVVTGVLTSDAPIVSNPVVTDPENRVQRTDTENRVQNAPKNVAPRPLTGKRNLHAEYEHPRFDVPTSWHLRHVKDLSDGEAGMLKFYRWLAERVDRTNEDTIAPGVEHGRFVWLDRCFAEWVGSTRKAPAPPDAFAEAQKRRQAELDANYDPRFDGLTLREKVALAKQLQAEEAS